MSNGILIAEPSDRRPTPSLREAIALADAVGLDYFGVGEHHTYEMPAFAGEVILASFFVG